MGAILFLRPITTLCMKMWTTAGRVPVLHYTRTFVRRIIGSLTCRLVHVVHLGPPARCQFLAVLICSLSPAVTPGASFALGLKIFADSGRQALSFQTYSLASSSLAGSLVHCHSDYWPAAASRNPPSSRSMKAYQGVGHHHCRDRSNS